MSFAKWAGVGLLISLAGWCLLSRETAFRSDTYQKALQNILHQHNQVLENSAKNFVSHNQHIRGHIANRTILQAIENTQKVTENQRINIHNQTDTNLIFKYLKDLKKEQKKILFECFLENMAGLVISDELDSFLESIENFESGFEPRRPVFLKTLFSTETRLKYEPNLPLIFWKNALFAPSHSQAQAQTSVLMLENQVYRNLRYLSDFYFGQNLILGSYPEELCIYTKKSTNKFKRKQSGYSTLQVGFNNNDLLQPNPQIDSVWVNGVLQSKNSSRLFYVSEEAFKTGFFAVRIRYKHAYTGESLLYSDTLAYPTKE